MPTELLCWTATLLRLLFVTVQRFQGVCLLSSHPFSYRKHLKPEHTRALVEHLFLHSADSSIYTSLYTSLYRETDVGVRESKFMFVYNRRVSQHSFPHHPELPPLDLAFSILQQWQNVSFINTDSEFRDLHSISACLRLSVSGEPSRCIRSICVMLFSKEGAIFRQNEKRMDYLIIVNTCPLFLHYPCTLQSSPLRSK